MAFGKLEDPLVPPKTDIANCFVSKNVGETHIALLDYAMPFKCAHF